MGCRIRGKKFRILIPGKDIWEGIRIGRRIKERIRRTIRIGRGNGIEDEVRIVRSGAETIVTSTITVDTGAKTVVTIAIIVVTVAITVVTGAITVVTGAIKDIIVQ